MQNIFDTFREAICISDRSGKILLVNRRHAELTGIPRQDIEGHHTQELVEKGVFDVVLNPQVVASGKKASIVQHLYNGRITLLEGHPILDDKGEVALVVTFIRDITAVTELREEVTAQKELLQALQLMGSTDLDPVQYPRIVHSPAMHRMYGEAGAIADTDVTVLLLGETGVGKDVVARFIHHNSKRAKRPFIKIDCGSIPENLMESELFGYVAGSFSGANKNGKAGLIEAAHTGTLFLDEIGELPLSMQSRLLRVLQDFEVQRIGATAPKNVDIRVIAATNKDLEKEVAKNNFRLDLFYRLKVAVLSIPPLRKRHEDVLPLFESFLSYYGRKYHKKLEYTNEVSKLVCSYNWPGNVRELENFVQGLVATCKKKIIDVVDLPGIRPSGNSVGVETLPSNLADIRGKTLKSIMRDIEEKVIEAGIREYGSMAEAAKHFGVDRSTLFRKLNAGKDEKN